MLLLTLVPSLSASWPLLFPNAYGPHSSLKEYRKGAFSDGKEGCKNIFLLLLSHGF
jgi:hypothetical protein